MNLLRTLGRQLLFVLGWFVLSSVAVATESVTYYHNDAAGTPVLATDANGNLLWKETYLPYGKKQTNAAASAENRIGFTGKPYDNATGLSYMGARYYDPLIGRFNGIDPKGFDPANIQSFNRYAYANNNPYKFVDPDGRAAQAIIGPMLWRVGIWLAERPAAVAIAEAGAYMATNTPQGSVASALLSGEARATQMISAEVSAAKEITLSRSIHGEAAAHAADAIKAGKPSVLTIDRAGAAANRQASIGALDKVSGKHLDEYPPAMFREGGAGASVRPINPRDNMSAGACIGNACRGLLDGTRVQIKIGD